MNDPLLHALVLAAAAVPLVVLVAIIRNGGSSVRAKSSATYGRSAIVVAAAAALSIVLQSEAILLAGVAVGMILLAVGIFVQAGEADLFEKFAAEQRVDLLTGLPNERLFIERLTAEHSRTKRTNVRYSVAIFEIDGFSGFSEADRDNGLRLLAESLGESIRKTDSLGRIGERQVAVLLVDTLADGARIGCDRARERFFFQSCGHSDRANVSRPMSLSVGIAAFSDDTVDPAHVVDNAQLALRQLHGEMESGIRVFDAAILRPSPTVGAIADQARQDAVAA